MFLEEKCMSLSIKNMEKAQELQKYYNTQKIMNS